MDCFADPEILGKIGTDIREGKCSWLINMALNHPQLTEEDKAMLKVHYGQENDQSEQKVKDLYNRLGLEEAYQQLELQTKAKIDSELDDLTLSCPEGLLIKQSIRIIMSKIFGRNK